MPLSSSVEPRLRLFRSVNIRKTLNLVTDRPYSPYFLLEALLRAIGFTRDSRSTCYLRVLISAVQIATCTSEIWANHPYF